MDAKSQIASSVLEFLHRNLWVGSTGVKTRAYQMYVRPKFEYDGIVWDPTVKTSVGKIETAQCQGAESI